MENSIQVDLHYLLSKAIFEQAVQFNEILEVINYFDLIEQNLRGRQNQLKKNSTRFGLLIIIIGIKQQKEKNR